MTSRVSLQEELEDLSCPLCGDIFRDPVALSCRHHFCQACLERHWSEGGIGGGRDCPLCFRRSSLERPPVSGTLQRACEALRRERARSDPTACSQHGEVLEFFCLEELRPVCGECRVSGAHRGHRLYPLAEALQDCKAELKNALKPLKEKLNVFKKAKSTCEESEEHMKRQAQNTEKQISEHFEELHQFLRDEEMTRLELLKKEEELKSVMIREKIENLTLDISSLSNTIRSIEQEMVAKDILFLRNYENIIKRTWGSFPEPELPAGALIDVARHLGSLKYNVWEKMMEIVHYTPVVIDPNTAANCFLVSEDLCRVQCCTEQFRLPDNPERFDISAEMLGSESFGSGRHGWEVEVRDNTYWVIGVAKDSINRKGKHVLTPAEGFWSVRLRNGEYKACSAPWTPLDVTQEPQIIRVQLDMDRGKVSFYKDRERTALFTFTDITASRVVPYFCTACKLHPLRILPSTLSVVPEHHRSY
ncbi:E3 ubiquitin-protein ligase TRIM39 [Brienomyrus brachyistius]|uniref:E3 ubiquitin-protein ligase TRIM39 n=1 Tax=Brienomyrus brachyistius TaxID=42636 RepID=UPI0020B34777|nr:E3 ubiquitin-protein ligase TRIM39 [Brienomyrus brachyistius]